MRHPRLAAAALLLGTLSAGLALAQPAPDAPPPGGPPSPPGDNGGDGHPMPPGPPGGMMHPHDGMMGHGPMMGWHHGPPSRGAVFAFHRGDSGILIRCAADEPTKSCVDAAGTLIDKVMQTQSH